MKNYLIRYMEITHPSYESYFNSRKGTISLPQNKV